MFGEKLKAKREQLGITQKKLSEKSGVSISTISAYESGRCEPSLAFAIILADALNTTVYDLYW